MKKFFPTLFAALFLAVFFVPRASAVSPGTPGDGFGTSDPCGYVMGTSTSTTNISGQELNTGGNMVFDVPSAYRTYQLCTQSTGYSYSTYTNGWNNQVGWVDFGWTKPSSMAVADYWASVANIDASTGAWTGYAWNESVGWVWFDWDCTVSCDTSSRVVTDMTTGDITGYAWNDQIGWISFDGLTQELAPMDITATVTIENGAGDDISAIDNTNAPVADGFQYYQVKLVLTDNATGLSLTSSDISRLEIDINPTSDSNVYLDQVMNIGTAIAIGKENFALTECATLASTVYSCEMIDALGETSFSYFAYSGAPTSDMLGIDTNGDGAFDVYNDRAGGKTIYETPTGTGSNSASRMTYFNDRDNARNKYTIDTIDFYIAFTNTDRAVTINGLTDVAATTCVDGLISTPCEQYSYTPSSTANLSFRPRFLSANFQSYYDGAEQDTIGDETSTGMYVHSYGIVLRTSDEYRTVNTTATGGFYTVNYETASDGTGDADIKFLIDSADDGTMDSRQHVDSTTGVISGTGYYGSSAVNIDYRIGYAQETQGTPETAPTNPTVEQWVCDYLLYTTDPGQSESLVSQITTNSGIQPCYFTGYLPRPDAHVDPENMTLIGAINSSIDEDIVSSGDEVSVLGIANYVNLRNSLYAQIARLIRNQAPSTPTYCGSLSTTMTSVNYTTENCKATSLTSLMSGTFFYGNSDVYVQGSTSFSDKVLVVDGADVYILGNIYGGKLGIIALSADGVGGNIYIDPDVTDLYVNIFADGTVFSDSGTYTGVAPVWSSTTARTNGLWNQLYIKGSIVSRNTIGGASAASAPYNLGDGTTTNYVETAQEYDLNKLREFRLCYPLDGSGNVDTSGTPIDCGDGESRSTQYTGTASNSPVIVEYDPPSSGMPVFNITSLNISGR